VDSVSRLRWALLASVGSVMWASLYMLREWQKALPLYGFFYRPGWVTGDANYFAISAVIVLPLCVSFVLNPRTGWERLYALGCSIIILFAFMITASRGGFLGLLAAALVLSWTSRQRTKSLIMFAVLIALALLAAPSSPVRRLVDPSRSDTEAADLRLVLWKAGAEMVLDHPFLGVGLGNFAERMPDYGLDPATLDLHVTHNTFLQMAAEMGLPSLLVFLSMVFTAFFALNRVRRLAQSMGLAFFHDTARGFEAGITGYMVAALFVTAQQTRFFWLMLFLSCSLQELMVRANSSKSAEEGAVIAGCNSDNDAELDVAAGGPPA